MFKTPNSKELASFVSNASGKITSVGKKTMESATVKKTVATVTTSSKQFSPYTTETSKKVVAAGKKTVESEQLKNSVNFLGNSTKEVLSESRKIVSNVMFNVFMVALIFLALNSIFMIYGIYGVISNFSWTGLLLVFGILLAGVAFSALAAYRCYKYGQFKIGIGIYHLLQGFFKMLISTSINEIEKLGSEKIKNSKVTTLLKKNGGDIIQSSVYKVPGVIRRPLFLLMEIVPFGDIIVEVIEESKRNATGKIEDQVMKRLDSHVSSLKPHANFTRFVGFTLLGNILVMGCLSYWI